MSLLNVLDESTYKIGDIVKVACAIKHAKVYGVFVKEGSTLPTYMVRFPDGRTLYCSANELEVK